MTDAESSPDGVDQRATRAVVDLDQFDVNVATIRVRLGASTRLMAVVKANAYGHGSIWMARTALAAGASALAVATVGEGLQLRRAAINAPILVLSPIQAAEIDIALAAGLDLTVATPTIVTALGAAARRHVGPARLHLKLDTGMHRGGADPDLAVRLAHAIAADPMLRLAGVMTHFATADGTERTATDQQAAVFAATVAQLRSAGIDPGLCHCANSAALLRYPEYHVDMVRAGIALYGLRPSPETPLPPPMRPILTLESRIARIHELAAGDAVGYGHSFTGAGGERIGLVPVGYADGYRRSLTNAGWMSDGHTRWPVVGRVSMDQTTILLPPDAARVGDRVIVIGTEPGTPSADDIASLTGTINYEVVTGLAARVPRDYVRGGKVMASTSLTDGEPQG